jgi:hypothetical protein
MNVMRLLGKKEPGTRLVLLDLLEWAAENPNRNKALGENEIGQAAEGGGR